MHEGFIYYLRHGGIAVYPLLLFSILGVAVVLERAYYLWKAWKSVKEIHPRLIQAVREGRIAEAQRLAAGQYFCGVYETALAKAGLSEEQIVKASDRRRLQEVQELKQRIWILGTIGSLAPFVGLFGTVLGIMHAFGEIARTQEGGFTTVSAGISEALIATAAGLLVGVLCVLAYNFFSNQIYQLSFQSKNWGEELAENLTLLRSFPESNLELAKRK